MKKLLLSLHLIFLFINTAFANIYEHTNSAVILDYLNPEDHHKYTLIIFDIDNTIATTNTFIGSDQWVSHEIKKRLDQGLSYREAWLEIADLYVTLQHIIDLVPVEAVTPAIIKELQNKGIIVIALTARLPKLASRTITQLKNIGVDFSHTPLWHEEIVNNDDIYYHYTNGIIFCDGNDKGKVLSHILNHIGYKPTKVIVIDDRQKHLQAVKNALHPDITFVGIRYGYLDEIVAQFDPIAAQIELEQLGIA